MSRSVQRFGVPALLLAVVAMIVIATAASRPSLAGPESTVKAVCCCGEDCDCTECNCDGENCKDCTCPSCDCADGCACAGDCGSAKESCCSKE